MPDDFGSPNARDATARDERTVQEVAQYGADLDKALKSRELGSVKISPQEQLQEWQALSPIPPNLAQWFTDQNANVEEMVSYSKKMLKRENE